MKSETAKQIVYKKAGLKPALFSQKQKQANPIIYKRSKQNVTKMLFETVFSWYTVFTFVNTVFPNPVCL